MPPGYRRGAADEPIGLCFAAILSYHEAVWPGVAVVRGNGADPSPFVLPDFLRTDAMDFDPDHDPLLDDDETLDFLLYREMERESARPPRAGCLGVVLLLLLPPATLVLLDLLH